MNVNLYKIKHLFNVRQFLSAGEKVTTLDGSLSCLAIGTSHGRILCMCIKEDAAILDFAFEASPGLCVFPIVHASALDSILALISSKLYLVEKKARKMRLLTADVISFTMNINPSVDSPFILQYAVSTNDRQIIVYSLDHKELTMQNKFRTEKNAVFLCYSRQCICFATEETYFVHDLGTNITRRLFPYDLRTTRPMIINVDIDEFLLNGMQGLGVFATVSGVSSRPPLVWGSEKVTSFVRRSSKIFVLNTSSIIIFDCFDGIEEVQRISLENGDCIYSLDGEIVFTKSDEFFRLEEISWLKRAEQLLSENRIAEALCSGKNAIDRSNDPTVALEVKYVKERAAIKYFFIGEFVESQKLSLEADMDPRKYTIPFKKLMPLPSGVTFTFQDPFPDATVFFEDRFLLFLKNYLMDVRKRKWDEKIQRDLDAILLRLIAFCGEKVDPYFCKELVFSYSDNKAWLFDNNYIEYLIMTMITCDEFSAALELANGNTLMIKDNEALFRYYIESIGRIFDKKLALKTLQLLISIDADTVFRYAPEGSLRQFQPEILNMLETKPALLIKMLEEWRCTYGNNTDTRLIKLYISEIAHKQVKTTSKTDELAFYRKRLRDLILTSSYNVEEVMKELKEYPNLHIELIFAKLKKGEDAEYYLKELLKMEDFDAAEILCSHFNTNNPNLYGILLKFYISLANERSEFELRARDILNAMEATSVQDMIKTISEIPEEWSFRLISIYARKAVMKTDAEHACNVIKKMVLGSCTNELTWEMLVKSSKSVTIDEQTTCYICGKQVSPEDASFNFHTKLFSHIDCR